MASTAPILGRIQKFLKGNNVPPATRRSLQRYIDDPSLLDQLPPGVITQINKGDISALQALVNTSSLPPVSKPAAVGAGVAATAAGVIGGGMAARDAGNRERAREMGTADIDPLESAPQTDITPEPMAGEQPPAPLPYQDEVDRARKWSEERGVPFGYEDAEAVRQRMVEVENNPQYQKEDAALDDFERAYDIASGADMSREELNRLRSNPNEVPLGWEKKSGLPFSDDPKKQAAWLSGHPAGLEKDDPRWQKFVYEHGKGSARHKKYEPEEWEEWFKEQQENWRGDAQQNILDIKESNEAISSEAKDQIRYRAKLEKQIATESRALARTTGRPVDEVMSELISTRPEYQPLQSDVVLGKIGPPRKYRPSDASQSFRNNMLAYRVQRGIDNDAEMAKRKERLQARAMLLGNNPRQNTANAYLMLGDPSLTQDQRDFLRHAMDPRGAHIEAQAAANPPGFGDGSSPLERAQAEMMRDQGRQLAYADGLAAGQAAPASKVEERRLALAGKYNGSPHKGAAMSGFDDGVQQSNPPAPPASNAPGKSTLGVGVPTGTPSLPPIAPGF